MHAIRCDPASVNIDPVHINRQNYSQSIDRKGHRVVVIIGPDEWEAGTAQVKDMISGDSHTVPLTDLVAKCQELLGTSGV